MAKSGTATIHVFQVGDKNYAYDSVVNDILQVSPELASLLKSKTAFRKQNPKEPDKRSDMALKEFESAREKGLFSGKSPEIILNPYTDHAFIQKVLSSRLNQLILAVTEDCSLR